MAQCGCACVVTLLGDAPELVNGNELDFQTFTRLSTDSKVEQIEDSHLRVGHIGCLSIASARAILESHSKLKC